MEYSLDYFTSLAENAISAISYPSIAPGLSEPISYTMATGGKRLRPALCMAVYAALSHCDPEAVVRQAIAIEMFHNFTLLHDDVMDRADLRRGRPTVHRRWGDNAAILSGDAMLTMAYDLLEDGIGADVFVNVFRLFSSTAMGVYQGQQLDMEYESRSNVTVDEYIEMIRLKTSVLIACATEMGAKLAGADADVCKAFYDYGLCLGLAFQLRDDWLDTFGDPAVFGKEIGGDIVNRKKTWLLITALSEAPDDTRGILAEDLTETELVRQITAVYRRLKLDVRCESLARQYADRAVKALDGIALDVDALRFFTDLALTSATRSH